MKPSLSIVIPTYNEEEYLPILLDCLAKQTFRDFEVIVADAFSKDRTREVAESMGAKVVDGGLPGPGRNRGAEVSQGDLIFFFDADVRFGNQFLENTYKEMQENYWDLATCEFRPVSDLRIDKMIFQMANLTVKVNQTFNPRAAGFCLFTSRRLFRMANGFDETVKIAEDHDFVDRASKFRALKFLRSDFMEVSIRRLEKEGRFSLLEKYFQVEMHLLTKGSIREDLIEYEFGNFKDNDPKKLSLLDELEKKIIQVERDYDAFAQKYFPNKLKPKKNEDPNPEDSKNILEEWKELRDTFFQKLTNFKK